MSGLAGLLLLVYGAGSAYLGINEWKNPYMLTPYATYWTTGLGIFLILAGILHFKAPHKAFLASMLLLLLFHAQMYFNALFYFARPMWPQQLSLMAVSIVIVLLSYFGYASSGGSGS